MEKAEAHGLGTHHILSLRLANEVCKKDAEDKLIPLMSVLGMAEIICKAQDKKSKEGCAAFTRVLKKMMNDVKPPCGDSEMSCKGQGKEADMAMCVHKECQADIDEMPDEERPT